MRGRALSLVLVLLMSGAAGAQMTTQPTWAPPVTADNESWFRGGEPIQWNGAFYYRVGAPESFNGDQMVRVGTYRGISLYIDHARQPDTIVFVPITGGRVQRYEQPRVGMPPTEGGLTVNLDGFVAQAPAPPTVAPPFNIGGSVTGTSGRVTTVTNGASTAARPTGINGAWFEYGGRRWVSAGKAVERTGDFTQVGVYRGIPVYQRRGDATTIFVPIAGERIAPFKPRGR
jgi:hypothetical protein